MKVYTAKKHQKSGFSLIDFSIWITIFSVMIIGFLAVSSAQNKHKNFVADNLEKQKILDKVNSYVLKEISHPSKLDINGILVLKSCDEKGFSVNNHDNPCLTNTPVFSIIESIQTNDYQNNLGFVPYKTLGLNQEDAIDSNNKFYLFLAHQALPDKPYQYYVFSQPEEPLSDAYLNTIKNGNEKQNNAQNNVIPGVQLSNCHITSAISRQYQQDQTIAINKDRYFDILSGATKAVTCSNYDVSGQNIKYLNNSNRNSPSDAIINFQCFSGGSDYTPNEKCERVCKTFLYNGITYNVEPKFLGDMVDINPSGLDNSSPNKSYSVLYNDLKISKLLGSILKLKCGTNYNYEIDSLTSNKPCQDNTYVLSDDKRSCQYTCAINSSSIGVGSNAKRYKNGTSYEQIINETTCVKNTRTIDNTLSNQVISCTEATPTITLTSGSGIYQICQCDNYYVKNNQNECVKGCKVPSDVVGAGNMIDNNKLYYKGQPVSEVFDDTVCLANASKNYELLKTEQVYILEGHNYCILRSLPKIENFKQKLCSCNSGYSLLAENNIANSSNNNAIFQAFPGIDPHPTNSISIRNWNAKYDCFLMCSATTQEVLKQNVANANGDLINIVIGYHNDNTLTPRQLDIINGLNTIEFKRYIGSPNSMLYLFFDGKDKKILQPLDCSAASGDSRYCLKTDLPNKKRLFVSGSLCGKDDRTNSLPFLTIKSGGILK